MSMPSKKKTNKYHELDNYEEAESADNPKALGIDRKSADIRSLEQIPKFILSTNDCSPDPNLKDSSQKHSLSSERKKEKAREDKNNFSPKTYKRMNPNHEKGSEEERKISFENSIKDLLGLLSEKKMKIERQVRVEHILIEQLNNNPKNLVRNDQVLRGLKRIFEILKDRSPDETTTQTDTLLELLLKVLDENGQHNELVLMLTQDSVRDDKVEEEIENNDNINALRESYHEFSLKKLMQMSFVEKRKQKALTNKLTPLTVETNSIKKNVLNGSTKDKDLKSQNEEEMEDSFCSVLKKNIVLIICSVLITALICIILLM